MLLDSTGADDFAAINIFGRTYISFKTQGKALPSSFTYCYDGVNFTVAGIGAPATAPILLGAFAAGIVDPGLHTVAYSFVNQYGAISPPSPVSTVNMDGSHQIDIVVRNGPANTVKKLILVGKANESELFFAGEINDNTTTVFVYNDYDTTLIGSADYLNNIYGLVPSCAAFKFYKGRLVLIGNRDFPDNTLISNQLAPETFNKVTGVVALPYSGHTINNPTGGLVIRSVLYITKPNGTYSTQDNGGDPSTWPVDTTDSGIGAYDNGISAFATEMSAQDVLDSSIIAHKRGLIFFNGSYADQALTWKIESIWQLIDANLFYKVCIAHDVWSKRIYAAVPLRFDGERLQRSTENDVILMADYSHALSPSTVKWSVWNRRFVEHITKIAVENFTLDYGNAQMIYQLAMCNASDIIWKLNALIPNSEDSDYISLDSLVSIDQAICTAPVIKNGITTFTMLNLEISGKTFLDVKLYNKLRRAFLSVRGFDLRLYENERNLELQRLINFQDEGLQVRLSGAGFVLSRLDIYGTVMYNMRPALLEQA